MKFSSKVSFVVRSDRIADRTNSIYTRVHIFSRESVIIAFIQASRTQALNDMQIQVAHIQDADLQVSSSHYEPESNQQNMKKEALTN